MCSSSPSIDRFSFEVQYFSSRLDYFATKTGAIVVPACGFDSVPSDAAAYIANKTLKSIGPSSTNGEYLDADTSISAFSFRGGISGGTIASFMASIEVVPDHVRRDSGPMGPVHLLEYSPSPSHSNFFILSPYSG